MQSYDAHCRQAQTEEAFLAPMPRAESWEAAVLMCASRRILSKHVCRQTTIARWQTDNVTMALTTLQTSHLPEAVCFVQLGKCVIRFIRHAPTLADPRALGFLNITKGVPSHKKRFFFCSQLEVVFSQRFVSSSLTTLGVQTKVEELNKWQSSQPWEAILTQKQHTDRSWKAGCWKCECGSAVKNPWYSQHLKRKRRVHTPTQSCLQSCGFMIYILLYIFTMTTP